MTISEIQDLLDRIQSLEAERAARQRRRWVGSIGALAASSFIAATLLWPGQAVSKAGEPAPVLEGAAACAVPNCFTAGDPALADEVNENFDFLATMPKATVFRAAPENAFTLSTGNVMSDADGLTLSFEVPQRTPVIITYQMGGAGSSTGSQHLVTNLVVDDVVVHKTIEGEGINNAGSAYYGNGGVYLGEVDAGSHTVKVRYRTPNNVTNNPGARDHEERTLTVMVLGEAS